MHNVIPPRTEGELIKIACKAASTKEAVQHLRQYCYKQGWFIRECDAEEFDIVAQDMTHGVWIIIYVTKFEGFPHVSLQVIEAFDLAVKKIISEKNLEKVLSLFLSDTVLDNIAENYLKKNGHHSIHIKNIRSSIGKETKRETSQLNPDATKIDASKTIKPATSQSNADATKISAPAQLNPDATKIDATKTIKPVTSQSNADATKISAPAQLNPDATKISTIHASCNQNSQLPLTNLATLQPTVQYFQKYGVLVSRLDLIEMATKTPRLTQHEILLKILGTRPILKSDKSSISRLFSEFIRQGLIKEEIHGSKKHYIANRKYFDWGLWFDEPVQKHPIEASSHWEPIYLVPIPFYEPTYQRFYVGLDGDGSPENIGKRPYQDEWLQRYARDHLQMDELTLHFFAGGIMFWPQTTWTSEQEYNQKRESLVKEIQDHIQDVTACLFYRAKGLMKQDGTIGNGVKEPTHVNVSENIIPEGTIIKNSHGQEVKAEHDGSRDAPAGQVEFKGPEGKQAVFDVQHVDERVTSMESQFKEFAKDANATRGAVERIQQDIRNEVTNAVADALKATSNVIRDAVAQGVREGLSQGQGSMPGPAPESPYR